MFNARRRRFMKKIVNNKAYAQLYYIGQLISILPDLNINFPKSIIDICFKQVSMCNDLNKFEFVEFNNEDEVSFFSELDYIVNYYELKDLTYKQIMKYTDSIVAKKR